MLALGHVIMSAKLPVRLRVLVPAVENAISGNAYRFVGLIQACDSNMQQKSELVCNVVSDPPCSVCCGCSG